MAELGPFCLPVLVFVLCASFSDTLAAGSLLGEFWSGIRVVAFNWLDEGRTRSEGEAGWLFSYRYFRLTNWKVLFLIRRRCIRFVDVFLVNRYVVMSDHNKEATSVMVYHWNCKVVGSTKTYLFSRNRTKHLCVCFVEQRCVFFFSSKKWFLWVSRFATLSGFVVAHCRNFTCKKIFLVSIINLFADRAGQF